MSCCGWVGSKKTMFRVIKKQDTFILTKAKELRFSKDDYGMESDLQVLLNKSLCS